MDWDEDDLDELVEGRDDLETLFDALLADGDRRDRIARLRRRSGGANSGRNAVTHRVESGA